MKPDRYRRFRNRINRPGYYERRLDFMTREEGFWAEEARAAFYKDRGPATGYLYHECLAMERRFFRKRRWYERKIAANGEG